MTVFDVARSFALEQEHGAGIYQKREVVLVRGRGARVVDAGGREYLDCASGHGVANLGHGHPHVVAAIASQAERLVTCPETYPNDRRAELLARLTAVLPNGLSRVFFCNSGTEAVEAAIKFARLSTGRAGVVACLRGFHGRTFGALSATWEPRYREPFEPLVPGFRHVPFDRVEVADAAIGDDTACMLVEVVQGEGGVHAASAAWLHRLRELCSARGALLVVDEVQTGFGRTGRMFACQHHDLVPDMLCLGKAIAGGLPMGAVALGPRVAALPVGAHGSTFGGNPLACAAALATLDVLAREGLPQRAAELGGWLLDRLAGLDPERVRAVRGLGLMVGVELRGRVTPVLQALLARGVLALPAGATVLRLLPPLTIARDDLECAAAAIDLVLAEAAS